MKKIVGLLVFGVAAFVAGWVMSNHCNAVEEEDDFDLDEIDDIDDVDDTEVDNTNVVDTEVETNKETEDEQ